MKNYLLSNTVWCLIFCIASNAFDQTTAFAEMSNVLNISVRFPSMVGISKLSYVRVPEYYIKSDQYLTKHCESSRCEWTLNQPLLLQIQAVASLVVDQRAPLINCNSGVGLFMLGIWHYTSRAAPSHVLNIISTQDIATPLKDVMAVNVAASGFWAQSLLVSSNTCELFQRSRAVPFFFAEKMLKYMIADMVPSSSDTLDISALVVQTIQDTCPALIRISSYQRLFDW